MQKKQFKDHILFEPGERDVLSNLGMKSVYRQKDSFLPIRKIYKNGVLQFICSTEGLVRVKLDKEFTEPEACGLLQALAGLLFVCAESAFLDITYIDISTDMIFYDPHSKKYYFVMVPFDTEDYSSQRKRWNTELEKFVNILLDGTVYKSGILMNFYEGFIAAEDKVMYIKEKAFSLPTDNKTTVSSSDMELEYNGIYGSFTLYISKDEFVIGKSDDCDGILSMNPTVSRHHCVIRRTDRGWTIEDIGSSNGTVVGNALIPSGQIVYINDNDRIRISDMEFTVKTGI